MPSWPIYHLCTGKADCPFEEKKLVSIKDLLARSIADEQQEELLDKPPAGDERNSLTSPGW